MDLSHNKSIAVAFRLSSIFSLSNRCYFKGAAYLSLKLAILACIALMVVTKGAQGQFRMSIDGSSGKRSSWIFLEMAASGTLTLTPTSSSSSISDIVMNTNSVVIPDTSGDASADTSYKSKLNKNYAIGIGYLGRGRGTAVFDWLSLDMDFGFGWKLFFVGSYEIENNRLLYDDNSNILNIDFDLLMEPTAGLGLVLSADVFVVGVYISAEAGMGNAEVTVNKIYGNAAWHSVDKSYASETIVLSLTAGLGTRFNDYTLNLFFKNTSADFDFSIPASDVNTATGANISGPISFKMKSSLTHIGITLGLLF